MGIDFVLNELSLMHFPLEDKTLAQTCMKNFTEVLNHASKQASSKVIRSISDLVNLQLSNEYYLFNWLNDSSIPRELRQSFRKFINISPIHFGLPIEEAKQDFRISEFSCMGEKAEGLGFAYLYGFLAISFFHENSPYDQWKEPIYKIQLKELTENEEILESQVEVYHISKIAHITTHIKWIEQIKLQKFASTPSKLWENRNTLFPNLEFNHSIQRDLQKFNKCPRAFQNLKLALSILNFYEEYKRTKRAKPTSPQTKNTPHLNNHYIFECNDGIKREFYWHVDICMDPPYRIYFHPKDEDGKIIIGYLGHLPTFKYPNLHL